MGHDEHGPAYPEPYDEEADMKLRKRHALFWFVFSFIVGLFGFLIFSPRG